MKLYENGAYLLNGTEVVYAGQEHAGMPSKDAV